MIQKLLLPVLLVVSLGTALFSVGQIGHYFTRQEIVIGSASTGQKVALHSSSVLGEATTGKYSTTTWTSSEMSAQHGSYQGYLFDEYLKTQNSPLVGQGDNFVKACQKYGAPEDCTLLLAIAKVETDYCKTDISAKQFNCWGFGGSGPNRILYTSFPQSIDEVTRRLMSGYGKRFFEDPNFGGLTYCGAHCVNWGNHVQSERLRINDYFGRTDYGKLF